MNIFRFTLTAIFLIASITYLVFAIIGHDTAWSSAAACGCSAAITCNVWLNKKNKSR